MSEADDFYSKYYVSWTSNAPPLGGESLLPGERPKNVVYVPHISPARIYNESPGKNDGKPAKRAQTSFHERQKKFPVLSNDKKNVNHFLGAKRAFLRTQLRKGKVTADLIDKTWKAEEKARQNEYQKEIDLLTTNIKIRDDEYLRRLYKFRPKVGEEYIPPTTGPRKIKKLPREIQDTTYPRNHLFYFGA